MQLQLLEQYFIRKAESYGKGKTKWIWSQIFLLIQISSNIDYYYYFFFHLICLR